eukprot:6971763-Pyramimonas_sp.AAC.1
MLDSTSSRASATHAENAELGTNLDRVMPSIPGKFNDEVDCDLMFYKQEHTIFHIIDRCPRSATGMELPDTSMTTILDAYHQCWMQFGPAK